MNNVLNCFRDLSYGLFELFLRFCLFRLLLANYFKNIFDLFVSIRNLLLLLNLFFYQDLSTKLAIFTYLTPSQRKLRKLFVFQKKESVKI